MTNDQAEYQPHGGNSFMADALKSCPCCGNEAELTFKGNIKSKKRSVTIKCKQCRLQRTDSVIISSIEWLTKESIKQWNNRIEQVNQY